MSFIHDQQQAQGELIRMRNVASILNYILDGKTDGESASHQEVEKSPDDYLREAQKLCRDNFQTIQLVASHCRAITQALRVTRVIPNSRAASSRLLKAFASRAPQILRDHMVLMLLFSRWQVHLLDCMPSSPVLDVLVRVAQNTPDIDRMVQCLEEIQKDAVEINKVTITRVQESVVQMEQVNERVQAVLSRCKDLKELALSFMSPLLSEE